MKPVSMFGTHKVIRCHPAFSFKSTVREGYQTSATPSCWDSKQFTQIEKKKKSRQNFVETPRTILGFKFSAVDCHCSGFLSVKNLSDPRSGRQHWAGQKSLFQYLWAHLIFRKISLGSKSGRVPLLP